MQRNRDYLHLKILEFEETFSRELDKAGKLLFETERDLLRFMAQMVGQMKRFKPSEEKQREQAYSAYPSKDHFARLQQMVKAYKQERMDAQR